MNSSVIKGQISPQNGNIGLKKSQYTEKASKGRKRYIYKLNEPHLQPKQCRKHNKIQPLYVPDRFGTRPDPL
jgi:hypothetical protein